MEHFVVVENIDQPDRIDGGRARNECPEDLVRSSLERIHRPAVVGRSRRFNDAVMGLGRREARLRVVRGGREGRRRQVVLETSQVDAGMEV